MTQRGRAVRARTEVYQATGIMTAMDVGPAEALVRLRGHAFAAGLTASEVARAFVALAGSLAKGYDVVDLLCELTRDCARLLDVASAGLLLADERGVLHVVSAGPKFAPAAREAGFASVHALPMRMPRTGRPSRSSCRRPSPAGSSSSRPRACCRSGATWTWSRRSCCSGSTRGTGTRV